MKNIKTMSIIVSVLTFLLFFAFIYSRIGHKFDFEKNCIDCQEAVSNSGIEDGAEGESNDPGDDGIGPTIGLDEKIDLEYHYISQEGIKFISKLAFSAIFSFAALFIVLSKKYDEDTKKWAFSVLTLVAGVWIGSL